MAHQDPASAATGRTAGAVAPLPAPSPTPARGGWPGDRRDHGNLPVGVAYRSENPDPVGQPSHLIIEWRADL
jgi:hypothetical protein